MPKLNEYLGSIVSGITTARLMSDIQTVKVAEEYAKHHLLKHFSIPRMRIDDVEMTIPVALDEINEKVETEYEPIDNTKFNSLVYKEILNSAGLKKLSSSVSKKVKSEIAKQTQELERNIRISKDILELKNYSDRISNLIFEMGDKDSIDDLRRRVDIKKVSQNLENILSQEVKIKSQRKAIEDLNIIAESHKLREQKSENIIYIKLRISEDGMEWNRTENMDGKVDERLLPE